METAAIIQLLSDKFPKGVLHAELEVKQPYIEVSPVHLLEMANSLLTDERLYFDFLHCISGVDYGEKSERLGLVYHLSSLIHEHQLVLKVHVDRKNPQLVPSLSGVWKAADWHEREAYDLLGIPFEGHPDMRQILLPDDWEGHPLRKDYVEPESYHGIKIKYEDD